MSVKAPLNDEEIRAAMRRHLASKGRRRLIVDELGIYGGAIRADVAVICDLLWGYEIKGETDSLKRLGGDGEGYGQIGGYEAVFDMCVLVCTRNHRAKAFERLPEHWGVIEAARKHREGVIFTMLRQPQRNEQTDPYALARLLWKDEIWRALRAHGCSSHLRSLSVERMRDRLIETLTPGQLHRLVRVTLQERQGWLAEGRQIAVDRTAERVDGEAGRPVAAR